MGKGGGMKKLLIVATAICFIPTPAQAHPSRKVCFWLESNIRSCRIYKKGPDKICNTFYFDSGSVTRCHRLR